jgi:hypothetical protein
MYHCAADALNGVWEHIANGMYGAIVVHPQNEQPAKEFYVAFGESITVRTRDYSREQMARLVHLISPSLLRTSQT